MSELTQYSYDTHLRMEDEELFRHSDRDWRRKHLQARQDIVRDLLRHGVEQGADYLQDDLAEATVTLTFTALAAGALTVPAGTQVQDIDPDDHAHGAVVFSTDAALVVPAGTSATVLATALLPGEPGNVPAGILANLTGTAPSNFSTVTNLAAATGGVDHQLTRACVYRSMSLVYMDLMRSVDDSFDAKRQLYGQMYQEEIERMVSAGLEWTGTAILDGIDVPERTHGRVRLERG